MPCQECGAGDLRKCDRSCKSDKAKSERRDLQDRRDKLELAEQYLQFSRCTNCQRLTVKQYCCPFCGHG